MTATTSAHDTSAYEVGYGKPPRHAQFRKGQSGNPGGRPRRSPAERANAMLLAEAFRAVAIKENDEMVPVPALQAILRSQIELAISGNYRAQRDILKAVRHIETESRGVYQEADSGDEPKEFSPTGEEHVSGEADGVAESGTAEAAGEGDESASDHSAMAATVAPEPAGADPGLGAVTTPDAVPPCSGETGRQVVQHGSAGPHLSTTTPIPAQQEGGQGGGEEFAMPANLIISPATDPASPRENGAIPCGASAAPWHRRTPAPADSRCGWSGAVTEKRSTGGGPAAYKPGRSGGANSALAESGKLPVKFTALRESTAAFALSRPCFAP